jgi:hypothetical protein
MLVTLNIILSADADIGRGSRMWIKTLRMRILLIHPRRCLHITPFKDIKRPLRKPEFCIKPFSDVTGHMKSYDISEEPDTLPRKRVILPRLPSSVGHGDGAADSAVLFFTKHTLPDRKRHF